MNVIAEIRDRLKSYPDLSVEEDSNHIAVTPEGGFTVWATGHDGAWTVGFEGWHEEFDKPEDALNCFAWGLSNECRLEVTSRGGKAHKWTVQTLEGNKWIGYSTTGLLFFQFWRKKETSYKQNGVINS